jgi:predicted enzyme related to lactoylglutathione lyase
LTCGRIVPNWRIVDKMWDAYIRVDDADAVYAEVQKRHARIDYTIYDAPHGFREFGVQDPDGHDIAFGATAVARKPSPAERPTVAPVP